MTPVRFELPRCRRLTLDRRAVLAAVTCACIAGAVSCKDRIQAGAASAASASSVAAEKTAPTAVAMSPEAIRGAGVVTAPVMQSTVTPRDSMPGTIEAPRDALVVVNTRAPGVVEALEVDVGDAVTVDQRLATIRSVELAKAQADYRRSAGAQEHTAEVLKRTEALESQGLLSPRRLSSDRFEWQQAKLEVDEAAERIRIFGGSLDDTKGTIAIRSPIAGSIASRTANRGESMAENAPLFTVVDLSRVIVELRAPGGIHVEPGTPISFTVEALAGKTFSATVKSASAVLDPETRRFVIRCTTVNTDKLLKPGMFVTGSVPQTGINALTVPETAVLMMNGGSVVFVAGDGGRFERRSVVLGLRADGRVAVVSGLTEHENVVVEGAFWVRSELQKSELEE